jgi:CheY-like chemotaxis protein/HPt (histidine-containing phosphotransfer) domain-containing protein
VVPAGWSGPAIEGVAADLTKPVRRCNLSMAVARALGAEAVEEDPQPILDSQSGPIALGIQVLLAEDNLINREVAVGMLERIGCRVHVVTDGRQACEAFAAQAFDLVLMDCQMPEIDGFEATRQLRRFERAGGRAGVPSVPIVALTANTLNGEREKCLEAGMNDFLSKPFRRADLQNIVLRWAGRHRARATVTAVSAVFPPVPGGSAVQSEVVVLDREALSRIRSLQRPGRSNLLERLIDTFLAGLPREIDAMEQAVSRGDSATAARIAHTYKSSSANLGAMALASSFAEIEKKARAAAVDHLPELVAALRVQQGRVAPLLQAEIQSPGIVEVDNV